MDFMQILNDVAAWATTHGIDVRRQALQPEQAGTFDGVSVTLNSAYRADEQTYYLTHTLGSIARWSLSRNAVQDLFDELRAAKADRGDRVRLTRAIDAYRAFERESSEFAVGLLMKLEQGDAVPSYTNFMRADLEALTEFHRRGQAPVWHEFFARWNRDVASGRREVFPFRPKPMPAFAPVEIEKQEIVQKQS